MKKGFIFIVLLWLATKCYGQYLTADEMIGQTKCRSFVCYNNFILNKGFSFNEASKESGYDSYLFLSDKNFQTNNPLITTKNTSIILIYRDGSVVVGFLTVEKGQYLSLLQEFKNKGFSISETKTDSRGVNITYKSSRYPQIILMVLVENLSKGNEHWTAYDFQVIK